ncbi:glycosyl hydrolase 20, domain 2 family protein, partial [Vibrio parahaemolyticus AQ3810]
PSLQR